MATTNQLNSITRAAAATTGNPAMPYANAPVSGYDYNPLTNSYVDPRTGHDIKINTFSDNEPNG